MSAAPILLHVGFHKTGTSSVQAALRTHRAVWASHMQMLLRDDLGDLPARARSFSHGQTDRAAVTEAAAAAFAGVDPADRRPLVVSSEDLSGSLPGRGQIRDYRAAVPLAQSLAEVLRPTARPLHIIYSTRAGGPWLRSLWWQHLRVTRMTATLTEFSDSYARATRFDVIFDKVRAMPDLTLHHVALEDSAAEPAGPVSPLLRLAGLPKVLWPERVRRQNARPDLGLEEVFLALNRSALPDGFVKEQKRLLLRKAERMAHRVP